MKTLLIFFQLASLPVAQVNYFPLKCRNSPFNFQGHLFLSFAQEEQLLNFVLKTSSGVCGVCLQTTLTSASFFFLLKKLSHNA